MPKFLLLRFSSIGDIVLTSPVIRWVKEQVPDAELHYLTKEAFKPLVAHHPYLTKVYAFNKNNHPLAQLLPQLKAEGYDYILDLHKNWRTWRLRWALRVPTLSFDKLSWQKMLLTRWGIDRMPRQHLVDRYAAMVAPLGLQNDGRGLDLHLSPAAAVDLGDLDPRLAQRPYVALAVGAAHATKRIPVEQLQRLCQWMPDQLVVLLGGPADEVVAEAVAKVGSHVINACGRYNLLESASLVQRAAVVVAPDTGLMHIAAAFKRPIISVWGSTTPSLGMYPYLPQGAPDSVIIEQKELACRPCSKIGYPSCPKGHFNCMRQLDMAAIAALVAKRLPPSTNE